MILNSNILSS